MIGRRLSQEEAKRLLAKFGLGLHSLADMLCAIQRRNVMTETTYVQQLRTAISGEFYFGVMCHQTKRRIAISPDASRGKQRYSQSGETIVSCHHCQKEHRFDKYSLFSKSDGNNHLTARQICWVTVNKKAFGRVLRVGMINIAQTASHNSGSPVSDRWTRPDAYKYRVQIPSRREDKAGRTRTATSDSPPHCRSSLAYSRRPNETIRSHDTQYRQNTLENPGGLGRLHWLPSSRIIRTTLFATLH